jgi:hypothetical protein
VCKSLAAKYPLLKEFWPINERLLNPLRLIFKNKYGIFVISSVLRISFVLLLKAGTNTIPFGFSSISLLNAFK